MLKAVAFDDEYIVLQGFENMIEWARYDIELVGTASDGHAALEMFYTLRPDIVISDIRMPGLDGLQLMELILQEAPHTYCIVFSGFNEFEYVKRAIQLGVSDYLEKPITVQRLEKALQKAKAHIASQAEMLSIKRKWEVGMHELLEKATLDLLLRGGEAEARWRELFGEGINLLKGATVFCTLDPTFSLPEHEDYDAISVWNGQEKLILMMHYDWPSQESWNDLYQYSEQADITVGCGSTVSNLREACMSYKEAQRALHYSRYLQMKGMVRIEDLGHLITSPKELELTKHEEGILLSMRAGNKTVFMEQVDRYLSWIKSERLDLDMAEREMLKLIYIVLEVAKDVEPKPSHYERFMPHVEILELTDKNELSNWFRRRLEWIADLFMEIRETTKHSAIERARTYIVQNISKDLSLQEVGDYVGLNPAYFSVLFKEVMDESYIKFLTRNRMELAKMLLQKGYKATEVSERVGYHTYRHFHEVFKKCTGQTPGQYRE